MGEGVLRRIFVGRLLWGLRRLFFRFFFGVFVVCEVAFLRVNIGEVGVLWLFWVRRLFFDWKILEKYFSNKDYRLCCSRFFVFSLCY